MLFFLARADPGWSVGGGVEAKIGRKGADFARCWPILEGAAPPHPPSGSATALPGSMGKYHMVFRTSAF